MKKYDIEPDCLRAAVHTNMAKAGSRKYHCIYKLTRRQRRVAGKHAGTSRTKSNLLLAVVVPLFYTGMQIKSVFSKVSLLEQSLSLSSSDCWIGLQRLVNWERKSVKLKLNCQTFASFQLFKCEDWLLFVVFYGSRWRFFGFCTVAWTK